MNNIIYYTIYGQSINTIHGRQNLYSIIPHVARTWPQMQTTFYTFIQMQTTFLHLYTAFVNHPQISHEIGSSHFDRYIDNGVSIIYDRCFTSWLVFSREVAFQTQVLPFNYRTPQNLSTFTQSTPRYTDRHKQDRQSSKSPFYNSTTASVHMRVSTNTLAISFNKPVMNLFLLAE